MTFLTHNRFAGNDQRVFTDDINAHYASIYVYINTHTYNNYIKGYGNYVST